MAAACCRPSAFLPRRSGREAVTVASDTRMRCSACSHSDTPGPSSRPARDGDHLSYLSMWKRARERREQERVREAVRLRKEQQFASLLRVQAAEEGDDAQAQLLDRAAAALAAAQALLGALPPAAFSQPRASPFKQKQRDEGGSRSGAAAHFLSLPPAAYSVNGPVTAKAEQLSSNPMLLPVMERERSSRSLPAAFESDLYKEADSIFCSRVAGMQLQEPAASHAQPPLGDGDVREDGSRWRRQSGVDQREDGVACNWTVVRGVDAQGCVEWEERFWEAYDDHQYKELGAEKWGRDSSGGVWHESWKESMWQDAASGVHHMEKSADKWAKKGDGGEWHEKWWEHYDASGNAEKWAHKWSHIHPSTPLDPGHAHVWHERWGENYDGQGLCMKYTDKWAERAEVGGGWTKWGDKWDEHFDADRHGVKQGETWWEGQHGERWNRTWGERHNGSGWVHKYGKSSSGENWDTHEQQDTWYETRPHFGYAECLDCSRELRKVGEKKSRSEDA